MATNVYDQKQKKGFWAVLWESMTKTGGCCGGGNCCGPSRPDNGNEKAKEKNGDLKAKAGA